MRNGAGHGHAQRALAAAAFAGNDQEVAFTDRQIDIIEDRRLLFIIDIRKVFHRNEAFLSGLQVIHAVIGSHFLFFERIEDASRYEEAQGRKIHNRRDDGIQGTDDDD